MVLPRIPGCKHRFAQSRPAYRKPENDQCQGHCIGRMHRDGYGRIFYHTECRTRTCRRSNILGTAHWRKRDENTGDDRMRCISRRRSNCRYRLPAARISDQENPPYKLRTRNTHSDFWARPARQDIATPGPGYFGFLQILILPLADADSELIVTIF